MSATPLCRIIPLIHTQSNHRDGKTYSAYQAPLSLIIHQATSLAVGQLLIEYLEVPELPTREFVLPLHLLLQIPTDIPPTAHTK